MSDEKFAKITSEEISLIEKISEYADLAIEAKNRKLAESNNNIYYCYVADSDGSDLSKKGGVYINIGGKYYVKIYVNFSLKGNFDEVKDKILEIKYKVDKLNKALKKEVDFLPTSQVFWPCKLDEYKKNKIKAWGKEFCSIEEIMNLKDVEAVKVAFDDFVSKNFDPSETWYSYTIETKTPGRRVYIKIKENYYVRFALPLNLCYIATDECIGDFVSEIKKAGEELKEIKTELFKKEATYRPESDKRNLLFDSIEDFENYELKFRKEKSYKIKDIMSYEKEEKEKFINEIVKSNNVENNNDSSVSIDGGSSAFINSVAGGSGHIGDAMNRKLSNVEMNDKDKEPGNNGSGVSTDGDSSDV